MNFKLKILNLKLTVTLALFCILALSSQTVLAAEGYKLSIPLPTETGAQTTEIRGPAEFIIAIYRFAWAAALLLAMLMIVIGAIEYSTSGGDTSKIGDAKDRIYKAILGVALLLGAYLLLYTINPSLVKLTNPELELIEPPVPILSKIPTPELFKDPIAKDQIFKLYDKLDEVQLARDQNRLDRQKFELEVLKAESKLKENPNNIAYKLDYINKKLPALEAEIKENQLNINFDTIALRQAEIEIGVKDLSIERRIQLGAEILNRQVKINEWRDKINKELLPKTKELKVEKESIVKTATL